MITKQQQQKRNVPQRNPAAQLVYVWSPRLSSWTIPWRPWQSLGMILRYPLVNKQLDPENHQLLEETNLPIPICQGLC